MKLGICTYKELGTVSLGYRRKKKKSNQQAEMQKKLSWISAHSYYIASITTALECFVIFNIFMLIAVGQRNTTFFLLEVGN